MAKDQREATHLSIDFWQPYHSQTLTPEDAREIVDNVSGFFGVLVEWKRKAEGDGSVDEHERKEDVPETASGESKALERENCLPETGRNEWKLRRHS
jgi:hypothetical protein